MAALQVLKNTGVDVLEAALVAREALQVGRGAGEEGAGV